MLANKQDLPNGRLLYGMILHECTIMCMVYYISLVLSCYHKKVHYDVIPATSTALSAAEIQEKMGLPSLHDRNWYIQPTCATSGEGLYEGLELLRSQHRGKEYDPKKIKYKYS